MYYKNILTNQKEAHGFPFCSLENKLTHVTNYNNY